MFLHGESRRDLPPSGVFPGLTEVKEDQAEEEGLATPRRSSREAFDAVIDGVSRHPLKAIFLADRPQGSRPCMPEPPWCERSTGGPRIADAPIPTVVTAMETPLVLATWPPPATSVPEVLLLTLLDHFIKVPTQGEPSRGPDDGETVHDSVPPLQHCFSPYRGVFRSRWCSLRPLLALPIPLDHS